MLAAVSPRGMRPSVGVVEVFALICPSEGQRRRVGGAVN